MHDTISNTFNNGLSLLNTHYQIIFTRKVTGSGSDILGPGFNCRRKILNLSRMYFKLVSYVELREK
jgi:hypothetical protein